MTPKEKKLREQLIIESIKYLSGFITKRSILETLKLNKLTFDQFVNEQHFLTKYAFVEKRTQLNWKIIRFHESEIIGSSKIPATIIMEKTSNNKVLSFSFADIEYVEIFFKRFSIEISNSGSDKKGDDSDSTIPKNKYIRPKL